MTQLWFALYLAVGVGFAFWFDRVQMKKDVAYGDLPAFFSLKTIRVVAFVVCVSVGFPVAVCLAAKRLYWWFTEE